MSRWPSFEQRFTAQAPTEGDGCWEWRGSVTAGGYGQIRCGGRVVYAHRIAYERALGPIPEGMKVCHTCDNPPCVRPDHFFLGTQAVNLQDMTAKGRRDYSSQRRSACKRGHPRTTVNLRRRQCRICENLRRRKAYAGDAAGGIR